MVQDRGCMLDEAEQSTREHASITASAAMEEITVFWDARGVILLDLTQGETRNSNRYQETLTKLAIRLKRPTLRNVILHHDNARPHSAHATTASIDVRGWTVLPHPAYSPDLVPSGFHLVGLLKHYLRVKVRK